LGEEIMPEEFKALQKLAETAIEFLVQYSFNIVGAIVVLIIGFLIAGQAGKFFTRLLQKKNLDITLSKFLVSVIRVTIIAFAVIIALGKFGITIAPFVAALSAMAFGASFAIQGPLSNYGAGLTIILTRPFVVGDTVVVQGVGGVVEEVKLACTILATAEGEKITIPNKHIVGEILRNSKHIKIIDGSVGISYGDDPQKAVEVIQGVLKQFSDIVKEPAPQVGIAEFGDSSVNIGVRYWVPTMKYYHVLYQVNQAVYAALKKAQITIPFPQRDVHVISQTNGVEAKTLVGNKG